jgi:hypothetical protein
MPATYMDSLRTIEAKTAAYQIVESDFAKILTTRGATATLTFTLPNTAYLNVGWWVEIYQCADWEMVIVPYDTAVANMITKNNLAAVSITLTEAGEHIGNAFRCIWNGTCWMIEMMMEETATAAIA